MNISGISPLVSSIGQAGIADAIQLAVLKKAIDVNAQGAVQLIQAA